MGTLIDLCGTPIQLEHVRSFRLVKRDCIFCPAYQEVQEQTFSLFARRGASNKKKFEFVNMVPFGIRLTDKEKPMTDGCEIKSFGEAATFELLTKAGKKLGDVAGIAADMLRIDTSGNQDYKILTPGRNVVHIKLREIPAKVRFLSGKYSDVYKNDSIYEYLGEPIAPIVQPVSTLVVTVDKATHVFFGGGIDLQDAEAVYHSLLDAYNALHEENSKDKLTSGHRLSLSIPKLSIPSIRIQSPFVIQKSTSEAKEPLLIENGNESENEEE